jgi:hypothetical protein
MSRADYPTEGTIRAVLLWRAEQFARATGMPLSAIASRAVNDPAFFLRLGRGRNFTVATYQRLMSWFDRHWPDSPTISVPSSLRATKMNVNADFCRAESLTRSSS